MQQRAVPRIPTCSSLWRFLIRTLGDSTAATSSRSCIKRGTVRQLKSQAAALQLRQHNQQQQQETKRKMMCNNQKGFPTVFAFAMVTLLSCCFSPVSSYFALPRVSRTSDAIIIDYEGVGYAPFSLGRGYSQVVDPGFVPLPAFNPYGMFYGGWPHFGRQISPSANSERAVEGTVSTSPRPFLVVLRRSDAAANVFFCSGTLISNARVLLAAQCLEQMSVYEISTVTVLVGLRSVTGAGVTPASSVVHFTRRISKVVIHAQYNAARYANDIAIISLDMPVNFITNRVAAAVLPQPSTDPDQHIDVPTASVMGWGPAAAGAASTAYRQGPVAIVANDIDCASQPGYGVFVTVNNICIASSLDAAGTDTSAYTCAADVGGPVVINTAPLTPPGAAPIWTVVGINSFTPADACTASPKRHGLKTRVSAFAAWIATYMA